MAEAGLKETFKNLIHHLTETFLGEPKQDPNDKLGLGKTLGGKGSASRAEDIKAIDDNDAPAEKDPGTQG